MKYDFDTIIPRRGTNSYKWDTPEEENVLPCGGRYGFPYSTRYYRCLTKAGGARYFRLYKSTRSYYDAVVRWFDDRHRWQLIPGGLSIRVVSCRLCQPLSKPWPCRVIKSSFRLLPIIVSTHLSVMTDASCLPIISFIRMAAT